MWPPNGDQILGLGFLVLYFLVSETLRWYFVGRPLEIRVNERYEEVLAEADRLGLPDTSPARGLITAARGRRHRWGLWNGAFELTGWMHVHRAEELLLASLPDVEVFSRLAAERTTLSRLRSAEATGWAPILSRHLDPTGAPRQTPVAEARADLAGLVNARHRQIDTQFESYVDLNRKAVLLGVSGLLLVGGLMLVVPDSIPFLLVGAIGGFLNRLRRIFTASSMPGDYGASWVPLLLAPLVGALTGWAGIAFVSLAVELKAINLALDLGDPTQLPVLALALLFGFAEQLIDGFSRSLAERVSTFKAGTDSEAALAQQPK